MKPLEIKPIAYIKTDFREKFGIPRQSGRVKSLTGEIIFLPEYRNPDALRGIEQFSHLWVIFDFSDFHRDEWSPTVRPPRLGGNTRVGVFASRSPNRPNPIGLSCVRLISVNRTEKNGTTLTVGGIDMLDGTPVLDIKPYIPYSDAPENPTGGYADTVSEHRLSVHIVDGIAIPFSAEKTDALIQCLADDPRPGYQDDENRIYNMSFSGYNIGFRVSGTDLFIVSVESEK